MNSLLKQSSGKQGKKGKKGCLFLIVGCFATILATALFVWLVSLITGAIIESLHGDEAAYALMSLTIPCYTVAFVLFNAILALWYIAPTEEEVRAQNKGLSPMLGQKEARAMSVGTKWLITAVILIGAVLAGAVAANTYRLVTPHGVSSYFFVETKSYEWRQVSAYTIDCDSEDGLSVTFTMRDGKQYEILQGVNSATDKFKEQYTSVTHFAADIDEEMVALQVPRNVRHIEKAVKFYKGYEGLWPYVSKIIGYAAIMPEPDETVAETLPGTEETETVTETN
ncbi:MAG: hypothetical protein IJA91_01985 [Clostridia bacterium]|nr:hypothetical protein [Clostridia bacterium]